MAHHRNYEHLRSIPLFADLDEDELDAIAGVATDLNISSGTVVMREGATAYEMIVVLAGTLDVSRGGEHLAEIGAGGMAGEMALLNHSRRNATVTASTDVKAIHIDGRAFGALLDKAPHIAVKMLPIVAGRVTELSDRHSD